MIFERLGPTLTLEYDHPCIYIIIGHPLILRSIELVRDHLEGKREIKFKNIGPGAVYSSMKEVYNKTDINRHELICRGVYLFQEINLDPDHEQMMERRKSGGCDIAVLGLDNETIHGFSRISIFSKYNSTCQLKPSEIICYQNCINNSTQPPSEIIKGEERRGKEWKEKEKKWKGEEREKREKRREKERKEKAQKYCAKACAV